ncbi:hypothetical protein CFBP498_14380 [Xanthomonas hortorum pv. vitians]|uniref:Uncharacterized protein n=2 Tax=Xanthomonas hortorum TaxID=56454 RepID=A0A6V7CLZ6_9XANT|nr:hypothetical protein CFBP498_14380 [Xanthomonas hortorum pv. vitians]CAD0351705.1 hypothetical protein CFBP2044_37090 [Xanthomonas hortorum pv. cynarae]CAD0352252.1 hypothetical protein CFBP8129_37610 [Xanthomonas hortorum pv. gardneri]CAH2706923.1 hypothetical protein NCPPB1935_03925 [Xanthomonas campestris pv. nigromaculans]CAD0318074.1 hypothetical protein CFBP498_14380 [Xanthomonas hortorum pv. vitians]
MGQPERDRRDVGIVQLQASKDAAISLDTYWDAHYRGRAWTEQSERAYWRKYRPGMPPTACRCVPCRCRTGHALPFGFRHAINRHTRPNTNAPLVPPKPKLLDITVFKVASRVSRRIGKPSARGSSSSICAEPAMKPSRSISRL